MAALDVAPAWCLKDLLPAGASRSQYVALLRAARGLAGAGRVELTRYLTWGGERCQVVVHRHGTPVDRDRLPRLRAE